MSLSREQLSLRRSGITATDMAALAGVHPHKRPVDVFLDKNGAAEPFDGNERSRWGEILEQPIREDYEQRHECRVTVPGTLVRDGWQIATPDGIVYPLVGREPERGMEIKVHSRLVVLWGGLEYGAPGTDEVPPHELVQCMWGMNVAGLRAWDLIPFLDGQPVEYTILRDEEMIEMLREIGARFRRDHLDTGTPPPPDGTDRYADWIKRKWRGKELNHDALVLDDDHPLRDVIMQLREARERVTEFKRIVDTHKQTIQEQLGDRTLIQWRDERGKISKITWKRNRNSVDVDYRAAFEAARERAAITLSAERPHLERALTLAQRFENDDVVREIAEAIDETISTLATIASPAFVNEKTTETEGARPFLVPRHWSKAADENKKED
jgi:putative phage-type endonuclease